MLENIHCYQSTQYLYIKINDAHTQQIFLISNQCGILREVLGQMGQTLPLVEQHPCDNTNSHGMRLTYPSISQGQTPSINVYDG